MTFLFTDVEGSTRLWAADTAAMSASLLVHDSIVRGAVVGNGGYVFATAGDSFAAAFGRASDAVRAATESQAALTDAAWPGPELRVRMGLHLGEAEERGGDFFGPVVNTAARVEAAGHGGQVLITDAVRTAAAVAEVTDLGVRTLRDVAEPLRLFQLGTGTFPALRVVDPSLSNLPVRPTRLIGRDVELGRVRGLLGENRLVTLTAVGGSGKTRLAIAVGEAELPHQRNGVWFIDLTAVSNGADFPSAIANGLGLNLTSGDPTDQILAFLADKQALVILDNCEHVIEEAAAFVEAFLATNSPAKLLATSREAFDIDGERTIVLGSLATDTADSPGVRLFVDRATAVHLEFELTDANASTVSAICARLDGMPLAIELAAARITVMSPEELLAGLDHRFQLLSGGRRRSRQRTLEATLDWSYDLLDTDEQGVFRALGVFVDGFDLDAVAAVAVLDRRRATGHIEALQAKSLVVRADKRKATRFRLLETVKAYAEDRLVDAGEAVDVRDRHLAHFHGLALADGHGVPGLLDVGRRLRHDCPNITSAFEWAGERDNWRTAAELMTGSHDAYLLDVRQSELDQALARAAAHADALGPVLYGCVTAQRFVASVVLDEWADCALRVAELRAMPLAVFRSIASSMSAWRIASVAPTKVDDFLVLAQIELDQVDWAEAGVRDIRPTAILFSLFAQSFAALITGDFDEAADVYQRATGVPGHVICDFLMVDMAVSSAMAEVMLGRPEVALTVIEALDDYDLQFMDGTDVRVLAHLALGDVSTATEHLRQHAKRAATGRYSRESNDAMLLLAALAQHVGDGDAARQFMLDTGVGRSPATVSFARHLAAQLDVADEYASDTYALSQPGNPHGPLGATRSLRALRTELTRRGWD
ncbi:MAG: adenylate/guanylate cyclase domain-containing protein [Ilumatobacteraceae bacterium]